MQPVSQEKRPWTPEEDALLDQLWNKDQVSYLVIADLMDRSPSAVMGRVWRNGWRSPRQRNEWSPEEDAVLERLWKREGCTCTEIGDLMGRPRNSVVGRIMRKGWMGKGAPRKAKPPATRAKGPPQRRRPPPPPPGPLLSPNAKLWTLREYGECPYPVKPDGADTWSCCNPTLGFGYCPGHEAVMHPRPV